MFQGIIKSDELAANVKWISYDIFNTWLKTATSCWPVFFYGKNIREFIT